MKYQHKQAYLREKFSNGKRLHRPLAGHPYRQASSSQYIYKLPRAGLEPAQSIRPRDFKSLASANSATAAFNYQFRFTRRRRAPRQV